MNYLYGVYFFQMKDQEKAKSYWSKTLEFNPKHVFALLSLSEALLREEKLRDADAYGKRAVEADPNSCRGHAILANVFLKQNLAEEAVKEADRAIELGHGQAAEDLRAQGGDRRPPGELTRRLRNPSPRLAAHKAPQPIAAAGALRSACRSRSFPRTCVASGGAEDPVE